MLNTKKIFNLCIPALLAILGIFILISPGEAGVSSVSGPPYPDLEPFYITSSKFDTYRHTDSASLQPYLNPNFRILEDVGKEYRQSDLILMTGNEGSFRLSGETGPNGTVEGLFYYRAEGQKVSQIEKPDGNNPDGTTRWEIIRLVDKYEIVAEGQVTSGKAAFDRFGMLQIKGSPNYQKDFRTSGTVHLTLKYTVNIFDDETQDYVQVSGTSTSTRPLAFLSCISDLSHINYCEFETGDAYGDYDFSSSFVVDGVYDTYYWAKNLEYEFELISADVPLPAPQQQPEEKEEQDQEEQQQVQQDQQTMDQEAIDEGYLDEPILVDPMADNPKAGFELSLGCSDDVYPEDGLDCAATITRGQESLAYTGAVYLVEWIIDGYMTKSSSVLSGTDGIIFPYPPPGDHNIEVRAHDLSTGLSRASTTSAHILVPPDIDRIPPAAQLGAAAGSILILSGMLWSEWLADRSGFETAEKQQRAAEEQLDASRQEWYEEQMARTDVERQVRAADQQYQAACEKEWKRFRDALLQKVSEQEKSEDLVDLYDDMYTDVCRDGRWDGKALQRLQEAIGNGLMLDKELQHEEAWKREMDFLNRRQKEWSEMTGSWTAMGVELVSGVLTGGASDLVFMPARAIGNALYAARRAELLGKTGWAAARSVMIESGTMLAADYGFSKVGATVLPRALNKAVEAGGWAANKVAGQKNVEKFVRWGSEGISWLQNRLFPPKPALPVIHQRWGQGPQVFVNRPIFKPGPMPQVDLGMENYLNNHIRPLSRSLADDMARMCREGIDIDPRMNNLLRPGERYVISEADRIAARILNNPAYKGAVSDGLVPASAQRFINQARDKLCKNFIAETFSRCDKLVLFGRSVSSYIDSVAVTGTGARPLSPGAIDRFTDFDCTAMASGMSETYRAAEDMFTMTFREVMAEGGLDGRIAEANMFAGIHGDRVPGGYQSEPMLHWHRTDTVFRGRSIVRLEDGGVLFNTHPDLRPMSGFGQLDPIPSYPHMPEIANQDCGRLLVEHVEEHFAQTGHRMTLQEICDKESKHLIRATHANNAGTGTPTPELLRKAMEVKSIPGTRLSDQEYRQLYDMMVETLHISPDLAG